MAECVELLFDLGKLCGLEPLRLLGCLQFESLSLGFHHVHLLLKPHHLRLDIAECTVLLPSWVLGLRGGRRLKAGSVNLGPQPIY